MYLILLVIDRMSTHPAYRKMTVTMFP